jgi:hypothetical protein
VLPVAPCTGVESFVNTTGCSGEDIWDAAWATLPSSDHHVKALGINAVHHRTQHQMHVHVAEIQRELGSWLQSLPSDGNWYNTSCGTNSSNGYLHCHSSGTGFSAKCEQVGATWTQDLRLDCVTACGGLAVALHVTPKECTPHVPQATKPHALPCTHHPPLPTQASSPSSISPFEQIYGTGPTLANVERFAGLVYSPSIGTFCAVQAQDRSVECLLYCSSECSSKDHLGCPA